jgi:hypothetical protein
MKVAAIKKFGKYRPGDEFDLPDKTARLFIKAKRLRAATTEPLTQADAVAQAVTAPVDETTVEVTSEPQTYETRDMVAEEEISPRTGRPKRTYTRRMQAAGD